MSKIKVCNMDRLEGLPGNIQDAFRAAAKNFIFDLDVQRLFVVLTPAPEQKHIGHKVRTAISTNPEWWQSLYASHPRKLDRTSFIYALEYIAGDRVKPRESTYFLLAFALCENFLLEADADVINFYKTGVPF